MGKPELAKYYSEGGNSEGHGRGYRHPLTNEYVYGVTSISGRYSAGGGEGGLAQYAADVTLRWANENWSILGARDDAANYRQGRFRWKDHTDHLAQVGTDSHEFVEADLTNQILPEQWGEALEVAHQWVDLRNHHWIEPRHVEHTVWSHTHGYAGTFDLDCFWDGIPSLMDVKTSRLLRENHKIQMAAMIRADVLMVKGEDGTWREEPMPEWERYGFIHMRPDYYNPVNGASEKAYWEVEWMENDEIDDLYAIFLGLLDGKKAEDRLKKRRKEKDSDGQQA